MFKVTIGNSKLGIIPAINLPAIITCREDAPCKKLCYANKGNFHFPCVKKCYSNNLKEYMENPKQAEEDIKKQLKSVNMVRWHASGDIVNRDYFDMMIRIAKAKKEIKFLCFTKKFEIINQYLDEGNVIPKNLKIIFSEWFESYGLFNPHNLSVAYVYNPKIDNPIPKNAFNCTGNCVECGGMCWLLKKNQSVFFHMH